MRLSRYFLPVLKEAPADAQIVSHQLMLRAGMIKQNGAGIYSWLPLGMRVLHKIEKIVREEQERAGAVELLMPTIQSADLWRESGRYDAYGKEMLRITDRHERDMLYGPTNEEMITDIFRTYVRSYKQLPLNLYHIQWKFRDEVRPRFGVMRGREFLMKDAYSFDATPEAARQAYYRMFCAYLNTFSRHGPEGRADARRHGADRRRSEPRIHRAGGDGRERRVLRQRAGRHAARRAPISISSRTCCLRSRSARACMRRPRRCTTPRSSRRDVPDERRLSARGIEVGHIFYFGTKYSAPMKAEIATAGRQDDPGRDGLLRHRRVASGRRDHRGEP